MKDRFGRPCGAQNTVITTMPAMAGACQLGKGVRGKLVPPAPLPEPAHEAIDVPVIRITSIQRPPERVVIDTNQPTIVPPPALLESASSGNPSPLQSYASVGPSPMPIDVAKKRPLRAAALRQVCRQPAYRPRRSCLGSF